MKTKKTNKLRKLRKGELIVLDRITLRVSKARKSTDMNGWISFEPITTRRWFVEERERKSK